MPCRVNFWNSPAKYMAWCMNLEEDNVGVSIAWEAPAVSNEGDTVKTTGRVVEVPVGDAMLGRVVNCT